MFRYHEDSCKKSFLKEVLCVEGVLLHLKEVLCVKGVLLHLKEVLCVKGVLLHLKEREGEGDK